ncbi:MAG: T9SS type A sorting domain-containing protein [Bacteroidota bacterium]
MKALLLIISVSFQSVILLASVNSAMVLTKSKADINVVLNNVCEYYSQVILCNGNASSGIHPSLGCGHCLYDPHYTHYDSLMLMDDIKFLEMPDNGAGPWSTKPMYIGNSNTVLSYHVTYGNYDCDTMFFYPNDTLHSDSIASIRLFSYDNKLALIRISATTQNFFVYDSTLSLDFSLHLNMVPLFLSLPSYPAFAGVIGVNQNYETVLNIIDLTLQMVVKDTVLGPAARKPFLFNYLSQQQLLLASQPGDSVTNIIKYDFQNDVLAIATASPYSGINSGTWENSKFHFQPMSDTSVNAYDRQVLVFDASTMMLSGTYNINKRLKTLAYPVNPNVFYFQYMYAVPDSLSSSTGLVYIYYTNNYMLADSFETSKNPVYFMNDYRCPVKVSEYDDSKVEWKVYPNPSSGDFKLSASGLICGRDYKIDIADEFGKIIYETTAHAKMTITLPTSDFKAGIYFVRIHTLKGYITQEIIKQ